MLPMVMQEIKTAAMGPQKKKEKIFDTSYLQIELFDKIPLINDQCYNANQNWHPNNIEIISYIVTDSLLFNELIVYK